jgi:hypothetical protein
VWNSFLADKSTSLGYTSLLIDDCVIFPGDIIFLAYVDNGIFLSNDDAQLQQAIKEIQDLGLDVNHPVIRDGSLPVSQVANLPGYYKIPNKT